MNKRTLFAMLAACLLFSACATRKTFRIWDENPTLRERWSRLTVHKAENPCPTGTAVIICPGGSYFWLDRVNEGHSVAKYLNKHGITAFVLQYRTAMFRNRHPAMINDLERAMYLVRSNSEKYGINPERIGVMGFSAGGHLAGISVIYSEKSVRPNFIAMIYPVVSMDDSIGHRRSRRNLLGRRHSQELAQKMSLEQNIPADMPPVFLLHCTDDTVVMYQNAVVMAEALRAQNINHRFILLNECGRRGHGFGIQPRAEATGWIHEFLNWLLSTNFTN